ncbi:MAG: hypothetical protein ACLU90_06755 [Lachnospira sp.]
MSKGTLKKKKVEIITVCICVVLIAAILAILIVFNKSKDFVYNKHLDEAVISIDDENITLKDFSYYIYIVEKQINDMAIKYNPDDPNDFWNTHFKNSLDSVFTRDYAKQLAKDLCEYDYIMEKETAIHNIYVTESEKESIKADAKDTYDDFSQKAKDNTRLSDEDIYNILCRRKLVEKYAVRAAQQVKSDGFEGDSASLLDYDGEYYKEVIKSKYNVTENNKLLDKITMGRVTVN